MYNAISYTATDAVRRNQRNTSPNSNPRNAVKLADKPSYTSNKSV